MDGSAADACTNAKGSHWQGANGKAQLGCVGAGAAAEAAEAQLQRAERLHYSIVLVQEDGKWLACQCRPCLLLHSHCSWCDQSGPRVRCQPFSMCERMQHSPLSVFSSHADTFSAARPSRQSGSMPTWRCGSTPASACVRSCCCQPQL